MVRRGLTVRLLAVGWLAVWVAFLITEPTSQNVAGVVIAVLIAVGAWRGLLVLREGTIEKRGAFGWQRHPTDLRRLTKVYLGRRFVGPMVYPMVLELWTSEGRRFSFDPPSSGQFLLTCATWSRSWRELAHHVSHYADLLGAEMDGETRRLIACERTPCNVAQNVATIVSGKPGSAPPHARPVDLSLTQSLARIALAAPVGFAFTVFGGWFKSDLGLRELLPAGLGGGALIAVVVGFMLFWDKAWTNRGS